MFTKKTILLSLFVTTVVFPAPLIYPMEATVYPEIAIQPIDATITPMHVTIYPIERNNTKPSKPNTNDTTTKPIKPEVKPNSDNNTYKPVTKQKESSGGGALGYLLPILLFGLLVFRRDFQE